MSKVPVGALALSLALIGHARGPRVGPPAHDTQPAAPQAAPAPRASGVVAEATRAAEAGKSAEARARYSERSRRNAGDRDALLGLATVARLTYEFDEADSLYRRLIAGVPLSDWHAIRARLGLAQAMDAHGVKLELEAQLDSARRGARLAGDRVAEGTAHFWMTHTLAGLY